MSLEKRLFAPLTNRRLMEDTARTVIEADNIMEQLADKQPHTTYENVNGALRTSNTMPAPPAPPVRENGHNHSSVDNDPAEETAHQVVHEVFNAARDLLDKQPAGSPQLFLEAGRIGILQTSPYAEFELPEDRQYQHRELEECFDAPGSVLDNVLERHDIVELDKAKLGKRKINVFDALAVSRLARFFHLKVLGYKPSEAAYIMGKDDEFKAKGLKFAQEIENWLADPKQRTWVNLVIAMADFPDFTDTERTVFTMMHIGHSFEDCARVAGLLSVHEARQVWKAANEKVDIITVMRMFHAAAQKEKEEEETS